MENYRSTPKWVNLVNIVEEKGSNLRLSTPTWATFFLFFYYRLTPYFVVFQTYSNKLTLKCPLFGNKLWNKNLTLHLKMVAICQNRGGKGLKFTFIDTHLDYFFASFFFTIGQLYILFHFKLILTILTLKFQVFCNKVPANSLNASA